MSKIKQAADHVIGGVMVPWHGLVPPETVNDILEKQKYIRNYYAIPGNTNRIFESKRRLGFQQDDGNPFPIEKAVSLGLDNYKELNALYIYLKRSRVEYGNRTILDTISDPLPGSSVAYGYHICSDDEHKAEAEIISWLGSNVGFSFVEEFLKESGYKVEKLEDN